MDLCLTTSVLRVHIDSENGRLSAIHNIPRDLDLITAPPTHPPFRIELHEFGWVDGFQSFTYEMLGTAGIRLRWETAYDITLISELTVRADDVLLTLHAINHGSATIDRIEYPIIAKMGRLGGPGQDELAHSHATGMLFHDPLDLFEPDPDNRRRLRLSLYPEGFAGSTMQFMAYYARARGGFFLGTEDSGTSLKWYTFFKDGDSLYSSFIHKAATIEPSRDFAVPYPVVLAALTTGTWYEAADRYRAWALAQPWAQPRPRSSWLLEQVGICSFGVNARYDRARWLDAFHQMAGTPVLHILGPNWAHGEQDYLNNLPRGRADWFPTRFNPENIATIRRNGDFWAPFEFDLLCNHTPDFPDPVLASRMVPKHSELNDDVPSFSYMCAGTDYWHDLHVWRDERLITDSGCDALYYDISVSNLTFQCLATNHKHPPGAGETLVAPFVAMYRDTRAAVTQAKGGLVPMGTEVMHECLIGEFDFYQARAEASPLAPFEVDCFRDWIVQGRAVKIPLFTYVYHERGPVRLDGWGQLAREAGDLTYWNAARVVLNGGLFELNYEWCNLEDLDGLVDDPGEHYYPFAARRFTIDPEKAAFVGELARARTGPANRYLAYGKMLPPPTVEAPLVQLDYFHYNVFPSPSYEERGVMTVPSVLATAWQHGDRTAWCVVNILPTAQHVRIDGQEVDLPPRKIVLIEF